MPGPLVMMGLGLGANLLSGLFSSGSAQRARKKRIRNQLLALQPLEKQLAQYKIGPTAVEGSLLDTLVKRKLGDLAARGVLNSSIAAPEVGAAIAPVEANRMNRIDEMAARIAGLKQGIYGDSEMPGYGDALANTLGNFGQIATAVGAEKLYNPNATGQVDPLADRQEKPASNEPLADLYPELHEDNPLLQTMIRRGRRERYGRR